MAIQIKAPDGSIAEFPDGTDDATITRVMAAEYGGPKPTSQALGFMEGVTRPLDNAARALEGGLTGLGVPTEAINKAVGMPSAANAFKARQAAFAKAEKYKRPGMVGKVAGSIVGTAPVLMATRNPWLAGGAQGALMSERETPGGVAFDAASGAVLNKVGGAAVDKLADAIRPVISPAVTRLRQAGVNLTPGMVRGGKAMVREDKLMSRPIVGDAIAADRAQTIQSFNRATVDRALKPLGVNVPANVRPGNDSIAFAKKTLRDAYDDVVPKMAVRINGPAFVAKLAPSAANLEAPQLKQFQALLSQHLKTGNLAGQSLKDAHGELRRLASSYSRDQSAANRELGKVLYEAADDLMGVMSTQNPALAPRLAQVNEAYRGYKIAAGAAKGADDGIFNTGQLKQSVLRGDRSKDQDAAARGVAFLQDFSNDARSVIPSLTPDSGTAGRLQTGMIAKARGASALAGYRSRQAMERLRAVPRPAWAGSVADLLLKLRPLGGLAAGGLLSAE